MSVSSSSQTGNTQGKPKTLLIAPDLSIIRDKDDPAVIVLDIAIGETERRAFLARVLSSAALRLYPYPVLVDAERLLGFLSGRGGAVSTGLTAIDEAAIGEALRKSRVSFMGTDGMRGKVSESGTEGGDLRGLVAENLLSDRLIEISAYAFSRMAIDAGRVRPGSAACVASDGRDRRRGDRMVAAMKRGFRRAGLDVLDLGVVPTPYVPLSMLSRGLAAGAMLTASHNPANQNGIKFFLDGRKLLPEGDCGDYALSAYMLAAAGDLESRPVSGRDVAVEPALDCAAFLEAALPSDIGDRLRGVRLFLDAANGAWTSHALEYFRRAGIPVALSSDEPDGANINRGCGVGELEGRRAFAEAEAGSGPRIVSDMIASAGAGPVFGIALDGDGDRGFVLGLDEASRTVRVLGGDECGCLIAAGRSRKGGGTAVMTIESDVMARYALEELGLRVETVDVGDKWIGHYPGDDMVVGFESSGHVIVPIEVEAPAGKAALRSGNGLLTALYALYEIVGEALAPSGGPPRREPFSPGFSRTFYTYFVDKRRFGLGTPLWAADVAGIEEGLISLRSAPGRRLEHRTVELRDRDVLYFSIREGDRQVAALFARNSGTEDKNAVYLKCRADLADRLLPIALEVLRRHRAEMVSRDRPEARAAATILAVLASSGPRSAAELEDLFAGREGVALHALLQALAKEGRVERRDGRYALPDAAAQEEAR